MNEVNNNLSLELAMATDVGRLRQRNEDELKILPGPGAAVLADGMGGHQAGDVAARLAVEVVCEEIERSTDFDQSSLRDWIAAANQAIRGVASTHTAYRGMGATIVAAVRRADRLLFAHVGDSRLYRLNGDGLEQLTEDHTLVQQYINEGMISSAEGKTWAGRNLLTRGLGIEDHVEPGLGDAPLHAGQVYLLCSDGLTDPVSDREIGGILARAGEPIQALADELVRVANANGGPDNISVALIRVLTAQE